jgi:hypothetical protein
VALVAEVWVALEAEVWVALAAEIWVALAAAGHEHLVILLPSTT